MELKVGDLVKHFHNGSYGIVISKPRAWREIIVCGVQWCYTDKKHLIDVDFLDKINGT